MTAATLAQDFGKQNVTTDNLYQGEGNYEKATVLFPTSPENRLQIYWRDENEQHTPQVIEISSTKSRWKTADGLTVGMTLLEVERLNRGPFRLSGFAWDYGGRVRTWSGGRLARAEKDGCVISARFAVIQREDGSIPNERVFRQVLGERAYSSGHPAMQTLNPIVRTVYVSYRR